VEDAQALRCLACGRTAGALARFCEGCGAPLAVRCPNCQSEVGPSACFCGSCGHPLDGPQPRASSVTAADPRDYTPAHLAERILRDRATVEGERRTVTVLFADAVGSTPLAERLGEEEMYAFMQGALSRMLDAVHHYEGHVASFTGDGVMAVFGAPIAREESERRAVSAALRLQRSLADYAAEAKERHGLASFFRVGLHTGPVVVGKVSDELAMEFTAIGDTVNLAARMEQIAEPGAVYLTGATHDPIAAYFECEALGIRTVKGKAEAVPVYRAVRERPARTRFEVATERGLAPLVGRRDELELLERHLARVGGGRGQVVFLSGEAGIGKSRLLLELRRRVAGRGMIWLDGHCISYGRQIPYLPLIGVVKRAFGVEETDDEGAILARLAEGSSTWGEAARSTVPYLRYLLSVDPGDARVAGMDPRERRAGILDALRVMILEESAQGPLVVAVEDLHWVDELSRQALTALIDVVPTAPVLLLLTSRPGSAFPLVDRAYVARVALDRLAEKESGDLVRGALGAAALPSELEALVATKAEGNPFYIEEVLRSLLETGVLHRSDGSYSLNLSGGEVRIPGTIQEVILARIDRLEHEARDAIQLASVIGREFTLRLLARISELEARLETALGELKALELIYEKAYFPELAFMFKHALTQDVAYSMLVSERRRVLHQVVAAAVEELYVDRLPEHYEMLAHHYSEAGEWAKAIDYLAKAARKAAAAAANDDALAYYSRALEGCERLGDAALPTVVNLAQRRASLSVAIGRFGDAIGDFDRMLVAAAALGDRRLEGRALAYRGHAELWGHQPERAEATLLSAIAFAGEQELVEIRVLASMVLSYLYVTYNRHREADAHLDFVREHSAELDGFGRALWGLLGPLVELWAGRLDAALELAEKEEEHGAGVTGRRLFHRWNETHIRATKGQYEAALRLLEETLATCERVGDVVIGVRCLNTMGYVYGELQDFTRAMEWNQRGVAAAVAIKAPVPEVEINARLNLAENLLALGRLDEAEEHFRQVEAVVRDPGVRWARWRYAQRFFHSFGEYWLIRGDPVRALALAEECLELAEQSGSRKNIVKGRRLRGQALLANGTLDAAEPDLVAALQLGERWATRPSSGRAMSLSATCGPPRAVPTRPGRLTALRSPSSTQWPPT
jgi:class 3 adenylate cyclase/tetratricopeptide (TPR) repeat protein